jgi:RTX calcium-binding nonapeptide repeat (4 copies)
MSRRGNGEGTITRRKDGRWEARRIHENGGCAVIRHSHFIAVVGTYLMGCAVVLMVVGCAGARSEAPQKEEQAHSDRCEGTRGIVLMGGGYATNDVPGCPKGGLLLGTDGPNTDINSPMQDYLYGGDGDDEVRGLGANDELWGGLGSDVIYGGPGFDMMFAGAVRGRDSSKNKLYGGDRTDDMSGADGEDVLHGGAGNDTLTAAGYKDDLGADKLYCGAGTDKYIAGRLDHVSNSCEVKQNPAKPKKGRALPL